MQISKFFHACLIVVTSLVCIQCSSDRLADDPMVKYIPEEALLVTALDMEQILTKLDIENIASQKWEVLDSDKAWLRALMMDPDSYGLNNEANWFVFSADNERSENLISVIPVSDIEKLNSSLEEKGYELEKHDGLFELADEDSRVRWNDDVLLIGSKSLKKWTKPKKTIASHSTFQNIRSGEHDVSLFFKTSNEVIFEPVKANEADDYALFSKWLIDNAMVANMDFNESEMQGTWDLHLNNALNRDLKLIFNKNADDSILDGFPSDGLVTWNAAHIDFNGAHQLLAEFSFLKSVIANMQSEWNTDPEEMFKLFEGDIGTAAYRTNDDLETVIALRVKNSEDFRQFITRHLDKMKLRAVNDNKWTPVPDRFTNRMVMLLQDDVFYLLTDSILIDKMGAGIQGLASEDDASFFGQVMASSALGDSNALSDVLGKCYYSGNLKGGQIRMEMRDQETSSLHQVFSAIVDFIVQEKRAHQDHSSIDSLTPEADVQLHVIHRDRSADQESTHAEVVR